MTRALPIFAAKFLFTSNRGAIVGGPGQGITDHAGSVNQFWQAPADSATDSIPHPAIHSHLTEPTGCHNMHAYVTGSTIGG